MVDFCFTIHKTCHPPPRHYGRFMPFSGPSAAHRCFICCIPEIAIAIALHNFTILSQAFPDIIFTGMVGWSVQAIKRIACGFRWPRQSVGKSAGHLLVCEHPDNPSSQHGPHICGDRTAWAKWNRTVSHLCKLSFEWLSHMLV